MGRPQFWNVLTYILPTLISKRRMALVSKKELDDERRIASEFQIFTAEKEHPVFERVF
jgi:hypothetical protein